MQCSIITVISQIKLIFYSVITEDHCLKLKDQQILRKYTKIDHMLQDLKVFPITKFRQLEIYVKRFVSDACKL